MVPLPSPILVPSILINLERLLDALSPGASALLGCRWSFDRPDPARAIADYDLPESWPAFAARIARFGGVRIDAHRAAEDDGLDRVALGQPIVVAVDSFYLPYRPAYQRVHSGRTIVIETIDEHARTAVVFDAWMPTYRGPIELVTLERARRSSVPRDDAREPLFAGEPIEARWWAVSIGIPRMLNTPTTIEAMLGELAAESASAPPALVEFGEAARSALSLPLPGAFEMRRAAALMLRAEVGLRAYMVRLLAAAAAALDDSLFSAELQCWCTHFHDLALARDILIKSTRFERPEYADIAAAAMARAARVERRFANFASDRFAAPAVPFTH